MTEKNQEWQSIDTAPKDREVLGYRPDQGIFIMRWENGGNVGDPHGDPDFECWWDEAAGWLENDMTPTHWMDLPNEPEMEWDGDLSPEEQRMIDAAWEYHKKARPTE